MPPPSLRVLVGVALMAGLVLIMVISFTVLTLAIGSPIYDKLSESVEREFGAGARARRAGRAPALPGPSASPAR